jgi:putative methylase
MAGKTRPSKRHLEIELAKLETLETPDLKLEQYPVSPEAAAELLYMAGFEHDDLKGRVIDLGTGTGRLAIGAALMGSEHVVGVDVDPRELALARLNAETAGVDVEWVESTIDKVSGSYDTVIMNPPYGTRTVHADTRFLDRAFQIAPVTYSIHKSSTREFLVNYVQGSNRRVDEARSLKMKIPHLFKFHTRKWSSVEVDLCRILG